MKNDNTIMATPNKEFFIEMLTKDITINKAIFDLIDNSIDAAIDNNSLLSEKEIKINLGKDCFSIYDNCGGIKKETARRYAFNFGRPKEYLRDSKECIGRFGVGMKRCIFKLGNKFRVVTNDGDSTYEIKENTSEWKKEKKWEFEFRDINDENICNKETLIEVRDLYDSISNDFSTEEFREKLRKEIGVYFSLFIMEGLKITINDKVVEAKDFNIIYKENYIEPKKTEIKINDVKCTIITGLAKMPEGMKDDPNEAGWYIYCNKRLVVLANKDAITGWGQDSIPNFHHDFAMFRGFVFFESDNVEEIPLNTTKDGIDEDNSIYITIKDKMKKHMEEQFKFLRKINYKTNLDVKRKVRSTESVVLLQNLKTYEFKTTLIIDKDRLFPKRRDISMTKISFQVEKDRYDIIKKELDASNAEEVGIKLFQYYVDMNEL